MIIANEVRSSKNTREWDRQTITELGQGGEVMERSVMIIVLGIVAHFCRQRHHQSGIKGKAAFHSTPVLLNLVETRTKGTSFFFG